MNSLSFSKKRNILIIIFALFVGIFSVIAPAELWWPFIIALVGILIGIFLISTIQAEDRKTLLIIFIAGLLLRFLLSILLYDISSWINPVHEGFFIGDGYSYNDTGWWTAKMWRQGIFPDAATISKHSATGTEVSPTDYWTGFIYFFVGKSPIVLFFINSLVGSLTIILIYLIAKQLFNKRVALIACSFCAFWPSLILWSTQNLKEPITILLVSISLWAIVNLRYQFKPRYILFLILPIFALFWWLRSVAIMFGLVVSLSIILPSVDRKRAIRAIIAIGLLVLLILPSRIPSIMLLKAKEWVSFILPALNHLRQARTIAANSAFFTNVNISSLPRILVFLPFGLASVLLAPFPWQLGSLIQILAVPEMLVWYLLLPFTFRGIFFSIRKNWKQSSAIILFVILMGVALALYEGNIGTMFRHRAIIVVFLLIFTSVGIVQARESKVKNLS